jgi:omega-6 fatty acid desaturase (delta-12 desaturase)
VFVLLSDAGLIVMLCLLACFCNQFGFLCMMRVYGVPYLIVNFWLVLITELQHSDIKLPHYSGNEWNYLRGALATVDRDYGILNCVFHHIGDTHVCHHLCVSILSLATFTRRSNLLTKFLNQVFSTPALSRPRSHRAYKA